MKRYFGIFTLLALAGFIFPGLALAEEGKVASEWVPIGIGLTMGIAALGGALGQGKAISSALESIGRNPSTAGKIFTYLLVGLAFIESLVIISFVVVFLKLG